MQFSPPLPFSLLLEAADMAIDPPAAAFQQWLLCLDCTGIRPRPLSDGIPHRAVSRSIAAELHLPVELLAGHLLRVALLRRRHRLGLRLPQPRDPSRKGHPPLQRLGLPCRPRALHPRGRSRIRGITRA